MAANVGERVAAWAATEPAVAALVLIGSRARGDGAAVGGADAHSDWDFQVVTSRPEIFAATAWLSAAGLGQPRAYVHRLGRLGTATKVSAVLPDGEIDLVIIPASRLRQARWLVRLGWATRLAGVRHNLGGLALVLRGGFRMIKGARAWAAFFETVARDFPAPRINGTAARLLAEGFVCDYVSARHKVRRGELLAAQRWLHLQLAEVNFQLQHELQQRRGETTFPDARRIEALPGAARLVEVRATPDSESLTRAMEQAAVSLRELMAALVPDWRWPDV